MLWFLSSHYGYRLLLVVASHYINLRPLSRVEKNNTSPIMLELSVNSFEGMFQAGTIIYLHRTPSTVLVVACESSMLSVHVHFFDSVLPVDVCRSPTSPATPHFAKLACSPCFCRLIFPTGVCARGHVRSRFSDLLGSKVHGLLRRYVFAGTPIHVSRAGKPPVPVDKDYHEHSIPYHYFGTTY